MTPEFAKLVNPFFHTVLDLADRFKQGQNVDLEYEQLRLRNQLDEAETKASKTGAISDDDFPIAKRALVYWADEVLTLAERNWENHTLEWVCFKSQDRAWKFYLDAEQQALKAGADAVEVFYLAMVLGFEGDILDAFRKLGDPFPRETSESEARNQWARKLEKRIRRRRQDPEPSKPRLEGGVPPLWGASMFKTALGWTAALLIVFGILVFIVPG